MCDQFDTEKELHVVKLQDFRMFVATSGARSFDAVALFVLAGMPEPRTAIHACAGINVSERSERWQASADRPISARPCGSSFRSRGQPQLD